MGTHIRRRTRPRQGASSRKFAWRPLAAPLGVPPCPITTARSMSVLWGATGFTGTLVAEYLRRQYGARRRCAGRSGDAARTSSRRSASAWRQSTHGGQAAHRARRRDRPRLARRGRASDARRVLDGGPLRDCRARARRGLRRGGHRLLRLHGRAAVRARDDRRAPRARRRDGRAHRVTAAGSTRSRRTSATLMVQEARAQPRTGPAASRYALRVRAAQGRDQRRHRREHGGDHGGGVARRRRAPRCWPIRTRSIRAATGPAPTDTDQRGVSWDADLGAWTGPFVMAAINTRVVRRSNAHARLRVGPRLPLPRGHELRARREGLAHGGGHVRGDGARRRGAMAVPPMRQFVGEARPAFAGGGALEGGARRAAPSCRASSARSRAARAS